MKNEHMSPEMNNFNEALRQVMRVSKVDLNRILAEEKAAKADKPRRGPKVKHTSGN